MTTSQQTTLLLDTTRAAGSNEQTEAAVPVRDTAHPLQGDQMTVQFRFKDGTTETIVRPGRAPRPFAYPAWPTSTPGPQATSPPSGQKPHPRRTDQMVYACYDQERGRPCAPPPTLVVQQNRTRTYLPEASVQEAASLVEAIERWLDDGGTLDHVSERDGGSIVGDDGIDLSSNVKYRERANTGSVQA